MKLRFQQHALRDLDAIRASIAGDGPRAAEKSSAGLKVEARADFPHMGRTGPGRTRELTTVRPT